MESTNQLVSSTMGEEYATPGTYSPPTRPSTWQLRFGKQSGSRMNSQLNKSEGEDDTCPNHGNQVRSPSVSERLLRALDAKLKEQEELGRECVDELIGRRNAFASEPELRLRTQTKVFNDGDIPVHKENGYDDVAAEAKEILRVRFQIETKADALRQQPKRRSTSNLPPRVRPSSGTATPRNLSSSTNARQMYTAPRHHERKKSRVHLNQSASNNQQTEMRSTKFLQRAAKPRAVPAPTTSVLSKSSRPRLALPPQLPMEHRQQLRQQAREARRVKTVEEQTLLQLHQSVSTDNNREEIQEQRRIEEQIERLTLENQQAAALEERLQHRKSRLESLSIVFDLWQQYVEKKQKQEARVVAEFNWRVMKCVIVNWKRYTHRQMDVRAADQARLKLVREQQMNEQAEQFHRLKCLPTWFYRWMAFVTQQKEHHAAVEATDRRRAQTQQLMERLQRQKTLARAHDSQAQTESSFDDGGEERLQEVSIENTPSSRDRTTSSNDKISTRVHQVRRRHNAWPATDECRTAFSDNSRQAPSTESPDQVSPSSFTGTTFTRAPKHVDKVYRAMEQRAVERKQRREQLKRRYEELEQKKREKQEEQRAAREAQLLQQRAEEKARVRERKLAEALALKEKQDRHDHMIAQRHKAAKHNRRRLLFYYALLPWQKHHALSERIARNATRWHELRMVYLHWERWQEFLLMRRKVRRHRERVQLVEAGKHYARSLQRRALQGFVHYHHVTEARALAIHRQNQWNTLHRSWMQWCKRLANEYTYQRKIVCEAVAKMQRAKLRRICAQWRKVTSESKLRKELEREKQQLWRKVRGWLDEDE